MKQKLNYCLLLCCFFFIKIQASHMLGGEIFYKNLSGNNYEIKINLYRDCYNGVAPFDNPLVVSVFNSAGTLVQNVSFSFLGFDTVGIGNYLGTCVLTPTTLCIEKGYYCDTVNLPPLIGGYTVVTQRCCRTGSLMNINDPTQTGATFWTHIPGSEIVQSNNSPVFINDPPFLFCNSLQNTYNHGATDMDGDSLVYSFSSPFIGLNLCCPIIATYSIAPNNFCPSPPPSCPANCTPPPYQSVAYVLPYNSNYPVSSSPAITINPSTGSITINPNLTGVFAVGVKVDEYRGGILIGTTYRDFHTAVYNCQVCTRVAEEKHITLISVTPNPAKNVVVINAERNLFPFSYNITDITGSIILNGIIDEAMKTIYIGELPKGLYFLNVFSQNSNQNITEKLIIN